MLPIRMWLTIRKEHSVSELSLSFTGFSAIPCAPKVWISIFVDQASALFTRWRSSILPSACFAPDELHSGRVVMNAARNDWWQPEPCTRWRREPAALFLNDDISFNLVLFLTVWQLQTSSSVSFSPSSSLSLHPCLSPFICALFGVSYI